MSRRYYSNGAPTLSLASGISSSATSMTVSGTFAGYPATFPYFVVLEYGLSGMEIVSVTNVVGSVATIVRGQDGTTGVSHSAAATVDAVAVAKDLDEANAHVNSTGAVHGLSGNIVGTTDTQTLTNKTLTTPTISSPTVSGTAAMANATHSGTLQATGATTLGGTLSVAGLTTLTGGITPVTVTDWNTANLEGFYYAAAGASNAPSANEYSGLVVKGSAGTLTQTVWRTATTTGSTSVEQWQRMYSGSAWGSWVVIWMDTGWVTSGVMQAGAVGTGTTGTVSTQAFRRVGNVVHCRVAITVGGTTINSGATGNIGNTKLATITDSRFVPSGAAANQNLSSNDTGPLAAWIVASTGDCYLCSVPPSYSIAAGGGWSFGGSYVV